MLPDPCKHMGFGSKIVYTSAGLGWNCFLVKSFLNPVGYQTKQALKRAARQD